VVTGAVVWVGGAVVGVDFVVMVAVGVAVGGGVGVVQPAAKRRATARRARST